MGSGLRTPAARVRVWAVAATVGGESELEEEEEIVPSLGHD